MITITHFGGKEPGPGVKPLWQKSFDKLPFGKSNPLDWNTGKRLMELQPDTGCTVIYQNGKRTEKGRDWLFTEMNGAADYGGAYPTMNPLPNDFLFVPADSTKMPYYVVEDKFYQGGDDYYDGALSNDSINNNEEDPRFWGSFVQLSRSTGGPLFFNGATICKDAWVYSLSEDTPGTVIVNRGRLGYVNVGWIKPNEDEIAVTGGTATSPGYVCLVLTPGTTTHTLEWRTDEPTLKETDGWHFPLCMAYYTPGETYAVITRILQHDTFYIGAWMP